MSFFDKLGKKASETYQATKEKTAKFSGEVKLKAKINDAKGKINILYKEIGEQVYNNYKNGTEENEQIQEKCEEILQKFDEISKLELDLLHLKDFKKCTECGAEINKKDVFCSKCGKEQPKQEEPVEVKDESEIQDVQDAEIEIDNNNDND